MSYLTELEIEALSEAEAPTYDQTYVTAGGYDAPQRLAALVSTLGVPTTASILDVGCGTGLVGKELKALGYNGVDGIDLSQKMLDEAAQTFSYGTLSKMSMLSSPDATHDVVCCCHVFYDRVNPSWAANLPRICKDGGIILFGNQINNAEARAVMAADEQLSPIAMGASYPEVPLVDASLFQSRITAFQVSKVSSVPSYASIDAVLSAVRSGVLDASYNGTTKLGADVALRDGSRAWIMSPVLAGGQGGNDFTIPAMSEVFDMRGIARSSEPTGDAAGAWFRFGTSTDANSDLTRAYVRTDQNRLRLQSADQDWLQSGHFIIHYKP